MTLPPPSFAHRLLAALLPYLYPPTFRRSHRRELRQLLLLQSWEPRYRRGPGAAVAFWLDILRDAAASAAGCWWRAAARRLGPGSAERRPAVADGAVRPDYLDRGDTLMSKLAQDLRYALRTLGGSPGFTAVAILTLALGIGANAAIFSVVHGVLLQPLPYPQSERLYALSHGALDDPEERGSVSFGNFADWRAQSESFPDMAAYFSTDATLSAPGEPRRVRATVSLGSLLEVLGSVPAAGRIFTAAEDRPDGEAIVVISRRLAEQAFGSAEAAVGSSLTLNDNPRTVVGVMPAAFRFPMDEDSDIWLPSRIGEELRANRTEYWLQVVARLSGDASPRQAESEMATIAARLRLEHPQANENVGVAMRPLVESVVGDSSQQLALLMAAVGLVLLIACANLGNLLLARGSGRRGEIAVREAMGASRGRLVRQLTTESALLALAGGVAGLAVGWLALEALLGVVPAELPRIDEVSLSLPVVGFSFALAALSGLLFGVLPALRLTRRGPAGTLRTAAVERGGGNLMGGGLVVAEVALSVVLLVGAGLLLRSFFLLQAVDPGFATENLLTFSLSRVASDGEDHGATNRQFYEQLEERLAALPGVEAAGLISNAPLSGRGSGAWLNRVDKPLPPDETPPITVYRVATPGYFEAAGLPLVRGRTIAAGDGRDGRPAVVINQTAARTFWPDEDPLGKQLTLGPDGGWIPPSTVVGIVGDVRNLGLAEEAPPLVYMPLELAPGWTNLSAVLRTELDPELLAPAARQVVHELEPGLPLYGLTTVERLRDASVAPARSLLLLQGVFAGVALLLAAVGVFGTLSYAVSRRAREMGIRMALGAGRERLLGLVLRQGLGRVALGLAIGLAASLALGRSLSAVLYDVSPADPLTYAGVALLLVAVAAVAIYLPARRASRVDPVVVLKAE